MLTYPLSHPECWENDKEETISFWPLFSITPSTLLTDDLLSPKHRWHRCEQVGKSHDTYIPSSITYDLISRNRTITAPTWWDCLRMKWIFAQHVRSCWYRQVPAMQKSALSDSRGKPGNLGQTTVPISTRYVISGAGLLIWIVRKTIVLILHRVVMSIKQYIWRLKRYLHTKFFLLSDGMDGFA